MSQRRLGSVPTRWKAGAVAACVMATVFTAAAGARISDGAAVQRVAVDSALLQRMLDAEDARASDSASLALLYEGLRSADASTRRRAARAFGRLERNAGLGALRGLLDDPSATVRAEAVNAIAQIVNGEVQRARAAGDSSGSDREGVAAVGVLIGMAAGETDQDVRDAIVRSLARLPYGSASAAVSAVSGLLRVSAQDTVASVSNFARAYALDALVRRNPALRTEPAIASAVIDLAAPASGPSARAWPREARVLRAAARGRILTTAVPTGGAIPNATAEIQRAFITDFADPDAQVRRQVIAVAGVATALDDTARTRLVDTALRDSSFHVRVEAVRAYARRPNASCAPLIVAMRDASPHVALAAIDALPSMASCRDSEAAVDRLAQLVRSLPPREVPRTSGRGTWHAGAHAVVALARVAPDRARPLVGTLVTHPIWQIRMYAGTAAGVLADTAALARLANDRSDNVRDAAVNALSALIRPQAETNTAARIPRRASIDAIFVGQLTRRDYQLVLDAARALEGAPPNPTTADALFAALDRITAEKSETSRDPRMELLARIQSLATASQASRLTSYLSDFDSAVAERAAAVLRAWGAPGTPRPQSMAPLPVSLRELAPLRDARVRITMAPASGGGAFELRLFVDDAPATIARFVSLARRGYYDNLTFHRVATNFVIQGGSPGANEYVGHERFMRDEVGLRSHIRGTLGISTRGRDTGDAQIFVNLIDNFRLDHDYTVFAEVVRGMNVVDGILEGDVIARVEVLGAR